MPLKTEIEMIETYLKIEKIRFENQLNYSVKITENALNQLVPRFLLQPLVENAIKHGYQSINDTIELAIIAKFENEKLLIQVKDSGIGFTEDFIPGYGLDSVSKKLQLLFPNTHTLEFINQPEKQIKITLQSKAYAL